MSDDAATLEISALTSGYGEAIVIRGVSMTVAPGEIVALLGKRSIRQSRFDGLELAGEELVLLLEDLFRHRDLAEVVKLAGVPDLHRWALRS